MKKFAAIYPWLFISVFFAILLVPLKNLNLNPHQINEDFYGRSRLISFVADFRLLVGDRIFPSVLVGNDGWLYYTAEKNLDFYQNVTPFSEDELRNIQESLTWATQKYAHEGIRLLVVIPPAKHSIYPENMPEEITVFTEESRLDQLLDYLTSHGNTEVLDLRPVLLEAKQDGQVYYATDTHWNTIGAFVAYQAIIDELGRTHPQLTPHELSDFALSTSSTKLFDLAQNIGSKHLREEKIELTPKHEKVATYREIQVGPRKITFSSTGNENLPKAAIYYDSFFFTVNPLLAEHFEQAIFVQHYLGGGLWSLSWVDDTKPDIVIVEFSERYIHDLPRLLKP